MGKVLLEQQRLSHTDEHSNQKSKMVKVGITGGIGSGKSYVAAIIEKMGYPVYYSDVESKQLVDVDPEIRKALIGLLGSEVYTPVGLNRPFLAEQIFRSDDLREQVNAIIHPHVRARFEQWAHEAGSALVFNEAAILFETGSYRQFDRMILVTAPEELKLSRVMRRDGVSLEEVQQRMSKQWSDDQKVKLADYVIINDGRPLLEQVERVVADLEK